MVIMTTPTCWPSAVATHSTHMVSSGSLSNAMMISRTSCKAPVPVRRVCLFNARQATRARVDVSASWRQEVHVGWASCPTRRRKATGILSCVSVPDRDRPPGSRPTLKMAEVPEQDRLPGASGTQRRESRGGGRSERSARGSLRCVRSSRCAARHKSGISTGWRASGAPSAACYRADGAARWSGGVSIPTSITHLPR